jgi:glutamyl-tRNA synthetase
MDVRVRYAPSPTGLQHIGGIRTALFNYFFARSQRGKFILRIEDTDQERSSDEAIQDLYDTLSWLNINPDEGPVQGGPYAPYIQSERAELYRNAAYELIEKGKAYKCFCTSERLDALREEQTVNKSKQIGYDGKCRHLSQQEIDEKEKMGKPFVIRLKVPTDGKTTFHG